MRVKIVLYPEGRQHGWYDDSYSGAVHCPKRAEESQDDLLPLRFCRRCSCRKSEGYQTVYCAYKHIEHDL